MKPLQVLSLGAGVQSTTMALMAAHGEITPMPDAAIFADTGWEGQKVMGHLKFIMGPNVLPFPVHVVSAGNIRDDLVDKVSGKRHRSAALPFFTDPPGMAMRQCTTEYKIAPIERKCRELMGLKPRQRAPKEVTIIQWIGISTDEITRMKPARKDKAWAEHRGPLIELGMNRGDCKQWMKKNGYPEPPKSSCVGCPFHSDAHWRDMRENQPEEWADAVAIDKLIRSKGAMRGMKRGQYMHNSRVPLGEADIDALEDKGQYAFDMECEGMCGV